MPVVDYKSYGRMLDEAFAKKYAYPAFNITSMITANAVLRGLAESKSDGIIQVSTGGGQFASGTALKDMVFGAAALAEYVRAAAERYDVYVALHTDHCTADKLDKFVNPLIAETEKKRAKKLPNLFNSHMFDGSTVSLKENMNIAVPLLERCHRNEIILEVEAGVVGGEEDDVKGEAGEKLYTTPEDMLEVAEKMGKVKGARFMLAATFGNVHGVYKPGTVKLKPTILRDGQAAIEKKYGKEGRLPLVFHGGSGSSLAEIHESIEYGVIKMNIDTDTQYAFTRPIAAHMFTNYNGVLKVDGDVGNKKTYDPRSYLKAAETSMAERVKQACSDLKSEGKTLFKK